MSTIEKINKIIIFDQLQGESFDGKLDLRDLEIYMLSKADWIHLFEIINSHGDKIKTIDLHNNLLFNIPIKIIETISEKRDAQYFLKNEIKDTLDKLNKIIIVSIHDLHLAKTPIPDQTEKGEKEIMEIKQNIMNDFISHMGKRVLLQE